MFQKIIYFIVCLVRSSADKHSQQSHPFVALLQQSPAASLSSARRILGRAGGNVSIKPGETGGSPGGCAPDCGVYKPQLLSPG